MVMDRKIIKLIVISGVAVSTSASADISGSMNATIALETACKINNTLIPNPTTGVNFGTINFGPQNSYFTTADSQLIGSAGNGIAIQCSQGIEPTIAFSGGSSAGSGSSNTGTTGVRAMKHTGNASYVTYNLYDDAAGGTVIPVNGTIVLDDDGSAQTVPVFGRAFGADGLMPGTYNDLVVVTVSFNP